MLCCAVQSMLWLITTSMIKYLSLDSINIFPLYVRLVIRFLSVYIYVAHCINTVTTKTLTLGHFHALYEILIRPAKGFRRLLALVKFAFG